MRQNSQSLIWRTRLNKFQDISNYKQVKLEHKKVENK